MENSTVLSDLELFHCPPLWTKVRLHGKKTTKCNKVLCKYVEHMVRSIGEKFENCPFLPRRCKVIIDKSRSEVSLLEQTPWPIKNKIICSSIKKEKILF